VFNFQPPNPSLKRSAAGVVSVVICISVGQRPLSSNVSHYQGAAMDMTLIQGTISGLKLAGDIAKGILELKSLTDVQGKVIELQSAILSAQSSALSANADQAAMVEDIRALKKEIADVKAWESQKHRYKLISPATGSLVYALKESMKGTEPPHWICTKCYEDGRKSILNPHQDAKFFCQYVCPVCKSQIPNGYRGPSEAEYATD